MQNVPFQSKHVLAQFILDEFLIACPLIRELRTLRESFIPEEMVKKINDLCCGEPSHQWSNEQGVLCKLKTYAEPFDPQLKSSLSKAYHSGLQAKEMIAMNEDQDTILSQIDRLFKHFARVVELIPQLMIQFKTNENVLFFLLKNQEELDKIYEPSFVRELCAEMFDGGLQEMAEFIVKRYRERGFFHLIPTIETQIAKLESVAV